MKSYNYDTNEKLMNKKKRNFILERLQGNNPNPTTELKYSSPFELLISVVLSARATDTIVNKATTKLYSVANTPKGMLDLGVEGIKSFIKEIGLYNKKAKNIIKICSILQEKYNSKVPEDRIALESLPGIGRKSTNVVLNTFFGWKVIAVDTHVFRVCNRTRFVLGKNVKQVEEKLSKVVSTRFKNHFHHWFVLHGRYTCVSRKPRCEICIIKDLCEYKFKISI